MQILGVRIDNLSQEEILAKVGKFLAEQKFHQIATVNPEFILTAQRDAEFAKILNGCDLKVADGIGIRFAFWRMGEKLRARFAGADLTEEILKIAEAKNLSIFLACDSGGLSGWQATREAILRKYPGLEKIGGADIDKNTNGGHLRAAEADIVFCSFGAPFQEKFLHSLKDAENAKIRLAMGVGGSFDYLTGKVPRAPRIIRQIGLEWLWRLIRQPKRFKRIWKAVIIFPLKVNSSMVQKKNNIRVRYAPSPTGLLHVGSLRSALYNYLFAKQHGGQFLLRIEDTDQKRYVAGAVENIIKSLGWAGLHWDEGVFLESGKIVQKGEFGPYVQSERLEIYKKYAQQLVQEGKAYYCFCLPKRLEEVRERQIAEKQAPMYDRYCLKNVTPELVNESMKKNLPFTIRLKVPAGETITFEDIVRGRVSFNTDSIDDQVLLKSDGYPTYHLANVVDDYLMKITHIIRGEEWLSSTPKHILLYRAFGWEVPQFAHLPLLLSPDKKKLSKRQGDVAVEDYIQKGYLKAALVNFIALLGWNPGAGSTQEIFSLEELIQKFELGHVHKAGAVFDLKKLDWINSQYIKKLPVDELYESSLNFWRQKEFYNSAAEEKKSGEYLKKVLAVEQDRLENLAAVGESNQFFFQDIAYDKELLRWKNMPDEAVEKSLEKSRSVLENIAEEDWTKDNLEKKLLAAAGDKKGDLLWPLRVALTGEQKSPGPFEVAWVLGKKETQKRLAAALEILSV